MLVRLIPTAESIMVAGTITFASGLNICTPYYTESKKLRVVNCFLIFIVVFHAVYSPIKINHPYHYWIYIYILFSLSPLVDYKKTLHCAHLVVLYLSTCRFLEIVWNVSVL